MLNNETWQLVHKPSIHKVVCYKWVYKVKESNSDDARPKYKEMLVAKWFTQVEGVDFHDFYSTAVKQTSIRLMLPIVSQFDLELEKLNVKTTFLHGELEETIIMEQPKGFIRPEEKEKIFLLRISLYGLKQSPEKSYKRFDEFMGRITLQRDTMIVVFIWKRQEIKSLLSYWCMSMTCDCKNQQ